MEDFVDFKLKKGGPQKDKIILFVIVKKDKINYNSDIKKQIILLKIVE